MKLLSFAAAVLLSALCFASAQEREWSRGKGQEAISAEFVCLDKATRGVVMMLSDGKEITVPYAKLSKEDQAYVGKAVKAVMDEAKRRKVAPQVSEIFSVGNFNTTFVATSGWPIGERSKLPGSFMVMGDVKHRGGKTTSELKATLTLVKFLDVARGGGSARIPLYRAENVRPAPAKNVRDARKGR